MPERRLPPNIVVDARAVLRAARASGATVILEPPDEAAIRESIVHLERRALPG